MCSQELCGAGFAWWTPVVPVSLRESLGAQTCSGQVPLGIHRAELTYPALCAWSLSRGTSDMWSLILPLLPSTLPGGTSICDHAGAAPP